MKRPQTKFHTNAMSGSKVIKSKQVKIFGKSKFTCSRVFLYQYFIKATITHIAVLLEA